LLRQPNKRNKKYRNTQFTVHLERNLIKNRKKISELNRVN
jgi:hypothetical protein